MTDWGSKTNKLLITPFDNAIGEIFLYDGSLRIALTNTVWEDKKLQLAIKKLITNRLDEKQRLVNTLKDA
jgi:hypothetical protein